MFKRLLGFSLIFGMAATAPPAFASSNCGSRDAMVEALQSSYAERLTAAGLQQTQPAATVLEVWSSDTTGSFTVLITHPTGISCVVATGSDFMQMKDQSDIPDVAG